MRRYAPIAALTSVGTMVALVSVTGAPAAAAPSPAAHRPMITSLSLRAGTRTGGSELRITGTHLGVPESVTVGGSTARVAGQGPGWMEIVTPKHDPGTVHVRITTNAGTSAANAASKFTYFRPIHKDALNWAGDQIPPQATGGPLNVSCPTSTFCVAADPTGMITKYHGSAWTTPKRVDSLDLDAGPIGTSLSCPDTTFCMLTDYQGKAVTYDGTSWSAPDTIDAGHLLTVTCGSPTFCLAFATQDSYTYEYLTYNGSSWSAPAPAPSLGTDSTPTAQSCAAHRCAVALRPATGADQAELFTFDGTTFTDIGQAPFTFVDGMSCVTDQYCVFGATICDVDCSPHSEWAAALEGTTVTDKWPLGTNSGMADLSCVTKSSCLAIDSGHGVFRFADGKWTRLTGNDGHRKHFYDSVSCGGTALCFMGTSNAVTVYHGGQKVEQPKRVTSSVQFQSTSCVTPTFCMNAGSGAAFVYNGTTFAQPVFPTPQSRYHDSLVSCATRSFCVFASGKRTAIYDGSKWTKNTKVDSHNLLGVSCGSPMLCAALDDRGRVLFFNGKKWTAPERADGSHRLLSIGCAGSSICAAADNDGGLLVHRHGKWGSRHVAFVSKYSEVVPGVVSCESPELCVAVDGLGDATTYNGTRWTKPMGLATPGRYANPPVSSPLTTVTCLSNTFCRAADESGTYVFNGKKWSGHQHLQQNASDYSIYISPNVSCPTKDWCFASESTTAGQSPFGLSWGYRIGTT